MDLKKKNREGENELMSIIKIIMCIFIGKIFFKNSSGNRFKGLGKKIQEVNDKSELNDDILHSKIKLAIENYSSVDESTHILLHTLKEGSEAKDKEILDNLNSCKENLENKIDDQRLLIQELLLKIDSLETRINMIENPPIIEESGPIVFMKEGFSDWLLEDNQDHIKEGIKITRQNGGGLYNHSFSTDPNVNDPNILWHIGNGPNDIQGPQSSSFREALYNNPQFVFKPAPPVNLLGLPAGTVLHPGSSNGLIADGIPVTMTITNLDGSKCIYTLMFNRWVGDFELDPNVNQPGGGEFEYTRTLWT